MAMAAFMARPLRLGKICPSPSRIGYSIPSIYRRGFSHQSSARVQEVSGTAGNSHNVGTKYPQNTGEIPRSLWLPRPVLETAIPTGVEINRSNLVLDYNGQKRKFQYASLRDSCKCPLCVDPHSKQRNIRMTDVPYDISPRKIDFDGQGLVIQWRNDIPGFDVSHTSTYDMETLNSPFLPVTQAIGATRPRVSWDRSTMQDKQFWISYEDYMNNKSEFAHAMRNLSQLGLIFIKDIPDSREEVEKIATRIGPLRNTFYGPTWDVKKVPDAENVAYTSQFLDFHMDLMYMNDPPGYQLLHCLQNSCDGGESLFSDAVGAARILAEVRPDYFETLANTKLDYEYNHEGAMYHNRWAIIERRPSATGITDNVKRVNYSPPFQGPMHTQPVARSYRGYKHFIDALKFFVNILEDKANTFELKLEPGQCVMFENRRVVHARRQFNTSSGHRWLAGAYLDDDTLISQFRRLCRDHPDVWNGLSN